MNDDTVVRRRLHAQGLLGSRFADPVAVVRGLVAVQAQDYAGAKWAIAQRTPGATDAVLDAAFASGALLRTHVLRPTWHFVTPENIRWLLALTAPRVHRLNAYQYRGTGVDRVAPERSSSVLEGALRGGNAATRGELVAALREGGIQLDSALGYTMLLMRAELDGVICSGGLRGRQHTYALLDERAPNARVLDRAEALRELVVRYFTGHGPATVKDFVWWSGLTVKDARQGIALAGAALVSALANRETYWAPATAPEPPVVTPIGGVLPSWDEFTVGYADRRAITAVAQAQGRALTPFTILANVLLLDGQIIGAWSRTLSAATVTIEPELFVPIGEAAKCALAGEFARYGAFLGRHVDVRWPA